jgi:hypothetical protein
VSATVRRWPLFLIASPAAVAIWSGWVGLGRLCGFGPVHPLPGIADGFTINTAITLPVGVEAYGAYALRAWLTPGVPGRAQAFARKSAAGALGLGMCGQVIFHLLAAVHAGRAPWPVTVLVSCIPVVTLGFGAALAHLLRYAPAADPGAHPGALPDDAGCTAEVIPAAPVPHPGPAPGPRPHPALEAAPRRLPQPAPGGPGDLAPAGPGTAPGRAPGPRRAQPKQPGPVTPQRLAEHYAADLAAGRVPSARQIKREWPVGTIRAAQLHDHLEAALPPP